MINREHVAWEQIQKMQHFTVFCFQDNDEIRPLGGGRGLKRRKTITRKKRVRFQLSPFFQLIQAQMPKRFEDTN